MGLEEPQENYGAANPAVDEALDGPPLGRAPTITFAATQKLAIRTDARRPALARASFSTTSIASLRRSVGSLVRRTSDSPQSPNSPSIWRSLSKSSSSSRNSPAISASPALKSIFQSGARPTLEQVEAVKVEMNELCLGEAASPELIADAQIFLDALSKLEAELGALKMDSTRLILKAMQARDMNENEICRGLCQQVTQNEHMAACGKIMANNILALLPTTTRARALDYLAESQRLVRNNIDRDPSISVLAGAVQTITQSVMGPNERIRPIMRGRPTRRASELNDSIEMASHCVKPAGDEDANPAGEHSKTTGHQSGDNEFVPTAENKGKDTAMDVNDSRAPDDDCAGLIVPDLELGVAAMTSGDSRGLTV